MNKTNCIKMGSTLAGVLALIVVSAKADTFGSGGNTFTIDFVNIGNAGNADDAGAGGGSYSLPRGGVSYVYRMGTYEVSQAQIDKATASGLLNVTAGAWTGNQPAASMTWYEMAAFVNYLNTSTGHQAAYNLTFSEGWSMALWTSAEAWQLDGQNLYRHKDAYYFLPSEDEWYKAAFHKNDGVTANYWDYATGSNTIPTAVANGTADGTAVYGYPSGAPGAPADVDQDGGLSSYGTRGQNGNVLEWLDSAFDGSNDSTSEVLVNRGGTWGSPEVTLRSSVGFQGNSPENSDIAYGFRVGSVPEPTSALLLIGSGMTFLLRRRRASAC